MARPRAAQPNDLLAGGQIKRGEVHVHGQERGEHEQEKQHEWHAAHDEPHAPEAHLQLVELIDSGLEHNPPEGSGKVVQERR